MASETRRRVLLFIDSLTKAGAQRQIVELAKRLDSTRYDATVAFYHPLRDLEPELLARGIRTVLIEKVHPVPWLLGLARFLRRERFDIIHSYLFGPNQWMRLAALFAPRARLITSERNINLSRRLLLIERFMSHLSDHIIANAHAIRQMLAQGAGVRPDRVTVIPNGVDYPRFRDCPVEEAIELRRVNEVGDRVVLGLVGRLHPQKNHPVLVDAFEQLPEGIRRRFQVWFVGADVVPSYTKELRAKIEKAGLTDSFLFLPDRRDVEVVYKAIDILVLPSLWEGTPNVVLEAMAAGRPVIVSDVSDNALIVREGIDGRVFPVSDTGALVRCLEEMARLDPSERLNLGDNATRRVEELYSPQRLVRQTEEVYERLLRTD